jgi:O-antigen ligase
MGILLILVVLVLGFMGGQITALQVSPGVRITLLDAGVALVLLYAATKQGKKRFIPTLWAPILGFVGISLLSLALTWGRVPLYVVGGGLLYIIRWIMYAALYWVAASSVFSASTLLGTLMASATGVAILGFVQYWLYPNLRNLYYLGWDPHFQRLFSTLLDPNFVGIVLVLALVVGMSLWKQHKKNTWLLVLSLLSLFVALLFTYSRSSYVSLVAAGLVIAVSSVPLRRLLGALAMIFVLFLIFLPKTGEGQNLLREASAKARIENIQKGLSLISKSPIFGYGFNILRYIPEATSVPEAVSASGESIPSRAVAGFDMSLVFVTATTGVLGLSVYLWLLVRMVLLGRKNVFFVAALAAIFVHSLFVNSLFYPWVMAFVWIWTGVVEREAA